MYATLSGLSSPPVVANPVLSSEDLASRWTNESFLSFVDELKEAVEAYSAVESAEEVLEAADVWRDLLGSDFPILRPSNLGLRLSDFSHAVTPEQMGWSENLDPRYSIEVTATDQLGRKGRKRQTLRNDGHLVLNGHKLHFKALVTAPIHVDVWWQVANTGGHARSQDGLRGEIFKGRDLNKKPTPQEENWESTSYTGAHLTRALLVRDSEVVAMSDWFQVNILAKGHGFRL
jgi:hypothetical protein